MTQTIAQDYCWKFKVMKDSAAFLFTNQKERKTLLLTFTDLQNFLSGRSYPAYVDIPKGILLAAMAVSQLHGISELQQKNAKSLEAA